MSPLLRLPLAILLSGGALLLLLIGARAAGLTLPPASAPALVALLVFAVGLAFAAFLWWLAARSFALLRDPRTTPEQMAALRDLPLALPEGTVRALLALIVGVIGLPLLLFSQALALNEAVAGYVNGIIAGVFGYYFGARSTVPEAQTTRRLGEALSVEQRANEDLRQREAAARREAAEAGRPAQVARAAARLDRHATALRLMLQRLGPALPPGLLPRDAEAMLEAAEHALAAARAGGRRADPAPLQAALVALTGPGGPLAALLRAAAPALPAAAGGPLAGPAMLLGLGWNLGAGAWRRFRARLFEAPLDPALFDPGAIPRVSAEVRLGAAPILARILATRLAEPGFLAGLLDTALREDAAERLWALYPGFAGPEEAARGVAELRAALLDEALAADLAPELVARVAAALQPAAPALRPDPAVRPALPAPTDDAARAGLEALALTLAELREAHLDPLPLLLDLAP